MIHGDILGERARLTPGKTALILAASGERWSYGELDARAARAALSLRHALGVAKGERVALLAGNRVEFLDLFFAAGKSGAVLVPLSTRLTPPELASILDDAGARVLIYDGASADTVRALQGLATLDRWVALDGSAKAAAADLVFNDLAGSLSDTPPSFEKCAPEDIYCLLYTSGTTGKPKGVMIPHRMVAWNGLNTACCWQLREDDVSPLFTPLYHAGGLGAFLTPLIAIGGTIVLHPRFDAAEVWHIIERERCTLVLGVPTIFQMLMEAPEFQTADLSHLRWFISGGAPLPQFLIQAYQRRGVTFKQGYGLTEVGVNCFSMTVEESARKAGSIGKPLMFTEARLVDPEGRQVPVDEVGELWLRGAHVCAGYWRNPEATAAAIDAQGFFHTGDLARRDEEGFFTIAGRQKDMLISGGINVYPVEIEGALLLHPAVQDAAVVGVPDPTWGEMGVAFVVVRAGQTVSAEDLERFLGEKLARYKIPKAFLFEESLPRTPYGKVVKGELRQRYVNAKDSAAGK